MISLQDLSSALIAVFEGCKLKAYQDSGGVWTIGFGHTGSDVVEGLVITHDQAVALLLQDQAALFDLVNNLVLYSIAAQSAYVSFGYNCGIHALQHVLKGEDTILNPKHCTDRHGNVLPGLQARRRLEYLLTQL